MDTFYAFAPNNIKLNDVFKNFDKDINRIYDDLKVEPYELAVKLLDHLKIISDDYVNAFFDLLAIQFEKYAKGDNKVPFNRETLAKEKRLESIEKNRRKAIESGKNVMRNIYKDEGILKTLTSKTDISNPSRKRRGVVDPDEDDLVVNTETQEPTFTGNTLISRVSKTIYGNLATRDDDDDCESEEESDLEYEDDITNGIDRYSDDDTRLTDREEDDYDDATTDRSAQRRGRNINQRATRSNVTAEDILTQYIGDKNSVKVIKDSILELTLSPKQFDYYRRNNKPHSSSKTTFNEKTPAEKHSVMISGSSIEILKDLKAMAFNYERTNITARQEVIYTILQDPKVKDLLCKKSAELREMFVKENLEVWSIFAGIVSLPIANIASAVYDAFPGHSDRLCDILKNIITVEHISFIKYLMYMYDFAFKATNIKELYKVMKLQSINKEEVTCNNSEDVRKFVNSIRPSFVSACNKVSANFSLVGKNAIKSLGQITWTQMGSFIK